MRNSACPSPAAQTSNTEYGDYIAGLSLAEIRRLNLDASQEEETYRRQLGMNEIDCQVDTVSDEDLADLTSEDLDYAAEETRRDIGWSAHLADQERRRNRPARHILRKGKNAE